MLDGEPYMETIPMDVPAIADDNGVWKDYVLDFTDVPTADVFFIGFRFTRSAARRTPPPTMWTTSAGAAPMSAS